MLTLALSLLLAQQPLFDGHTLDGWMWTFAESPIQPSWDVEDGAIRTTEMGEEVYLLTRQSFRDFQLDFEWKASKGANSGIKYRLQGWGDDSKRLEPFGLEYQITDDIDNKDALSTPKHSTGALYEYIAPTKSAPAGPDVWHKGRIVAIGKHIEHWVDGQRVVNVDLDSPFAAAEFAKSSRRKSAPVLLRQEKRESPIALQYHDGDVRFRNLVIRRLGS